MGKVKDPFYLPVARIDGRLDVVGTPHEDDEGPASVLRRALDNDGGALSYVEASTDHDVKQYEVYICGQGNRKSPEMFTTRAVELWREEGRGLLAP
jgi:hypothetical protein